MFGVNSVNKCITAAARREFSRCCVFPHTQIMTQKSKMRWIDDFNHFDIRIKRRGR